jgi:rare lipoprotein A
MDYRVRRGRWLKGAVILALTSLLAACASVGGARTGGGSSPAAPVIREPAPIVSGTMRPYEIRGRRYVPRDQPNYDEVGLASWYGAQFNGRPTASGERFDMNALSAAHKTLPLPGLVEVTNLSNGRSAVLRLNDRGPFVDSRIIDLSRGAAEELDMLSEGVGRVRVRYLGPAPRLGTMPLQYASTRAPASPAPARSEAPAPRPYAPAPTPRSEPIVRADDGRVWVQAGSFLDSTAAHLTAESLGEQARVTSAAVDGQTWFRVMVGPWSDANAAERARQGIVALGAREALLISGR